MQRQDIRYKNVVLVAGEVSCGKTTLCLRMAGFGAPRTRPTFGVDFLVAGESADIVWDTPPSNGTKLPVAAWGYLRDVEEAFVVLGASHDVAVKLCAQLRQVQLRSTLVIQQKRFARPSMQLLSCAADRVAYGHTEPLAQALLRREHENLCEVAAFASGAMAPVYLSHATRAAVLAAAAAVVWLRSIQLRTPTATAQKQRVEFAKHSIAVAGGLMYAPRRKQDWPCMWWHVLHACASVFAWWCVPTQMPRWPALALAPSTISRVLGASAWAPAALEQPEALLAPTAALLLARMAPMHPRVLVTTLLLSAALGVAPSIPVLCAAVQGDRCTQRQRAIFVVGITATAPNVRYVLLALALLLTLTNVREIHDNCLWVAAIALLLAHDTQ